MPIIPQVNLQWVNLLGLPKSSDLKPRPSGRGVCQVPTLSAMDPISKFAQSLQKCLGIQGTIHRFPALCWLICLFLNPIRSFFVYMLCEAWHLWRCVQSFDPTINHHTITSQAKKRTDHDLHPRNMHRVQTVCRRFRKWG